MSAVESRVAGSQAFESAKELAMIDCDGSEFEEGFARACRRHADAYFGSQERSELRTMSVQEAIRFHNKPIRYGEFITQQYKSIPIERLCFYADSAVELQAYLRSEVGQKRIAEGR